MALGWRWNGVRMALHGYAVMMNLNPVRDATYIVRCQVEYSTATQTAVLRCLLEKPATGERCSFTDLEALLVMLRADITDLQVQIIAVDE